MSLVGESRFAGINIWVPLIELTIENGTLFVLPSNIEYSSSIEAAAFLNFLVR
jgi:hypothetical protein